MMISIIMPTYQNAQFIGRAIDSVLNQSFKDFELIIIDNFSSDETEEIVKSYDDSRISYRKFKNFGIISKSRNEGIKESNGKFIAFLDSDDWWHKDKLKICFSKMNNSDFIYHKVRIIKKNRRINLFNFGRRPFKKNLYHSLLDFGNFIPNSSVIISRSLIERAGLISENPDKVTWEDFDYWIKISKLNKKYKFINKALGYYWIGDSNNTTSLRTRENISNMKKILFSESRPPIWLEYQDAISLHEIGEVRNSILKLRSLVYHERPTLHIKIKILIRLFQFSIMSFFLRNE